MEHFADLNRWNPGIPQSAQKRPGISGGNRDQQAPGSLWVEENRADLARDRAVVADQAFCKITIRFESARNVAGANAIDRAFEHRNSRGFEDEADIRCQRHFASVADQPEAGDVGQGVDIERVVRCGASLRLDGRKPVHRVVPVITSAAVLFRVVIDFTAAVDPLLLGDTFLDCRRNHSRTQRLREQ